MYMIATHSYSSDGPSEISGPLLLTTTVVTDYLTSAFIVTDYGESTG
jgi:hypothetical protein